MTTFRWWRLSKWRKGGLTCGYCPKKPSEILKVIILLNHLKYNMYVYVYAPKVPIIIVTLWRHSSLLTSLRREKKIWRRLTKDRTHLSFGRQGNIIIIIVTIIEHCQDHCHNYNCQDHPHNYWALSRSSSQLSSTVKIIVTIITFKSILIIIQHCQDLSHNYWALSRSSPIMLTSSGGAWTAC